MHGACGRNRAVLLDLSGLAVETLRKTQLAKDGFFTVRGIAGEQVLFAECAASLPDPSRRAFVETSQMAFENRRGRGRQPPFA